MHIIDLTPYLPPQEVSVRKPHGATVFVAAVESIVTAAIGLCFFAGIILFFSML